MRYLLYLLLPAFLAAQASSPVVRNPWLDVFTTAGLAVSGNASVGGNLTVAGSVSCGAACTGAKVFSGETVPSSCSTPGTFFLLTTTDAMYSCNGALWVPLLTNPFHDIFAADSLNIGGAGITTPSTISVVTPNPMTGINDPFRVSVNDCPFSIENGAGTYPVLQAIVGCVKAPDDQFIGGISAGVSGYSLGGGDVSTTPPVGGFFQGLPGAATNVIVEGVNTTVSNILPNALGAPVSIFSIEADVNTAANGSGTPPANAYGIVAVSAATQTPTNAFYAFDTRVSIPPSNQWKVGYFSEPGAAAIGMQLWPTTTSAVNSTSQPIQLISRDGSGNPLLSDFYLDSSGSFQFQVGSQTGNVNLNPQVVPNANSPELSFTSYNGSGVAQVGGMFLDFFGNLNLSPSTTAFASTQFKNGAGTTIAEVDSTEFKIDPVTADPGCSVVGQVGSFWVSKAVPTVLSYCKQTGASTFAWSVVTTTP